MDLITDDALHSSLHLSFIFVRYTKWFIYGLRKMRCSSHLQVFFPNGRASVYLQNGLCFLL